MRRLIAGLFVALITSFLSAQSQPQPVPTSDAQAISLAQKSISAMLGGATISDVTLDGNVISIVGLDSETGTGTFRAKGTAKSRVDLDLGKENRSDVRNSPNGFPAGASRKGSAPVNAYPQHNCWTDATWFFSIFSSLSQTANLQIVFNYVGQEQREGITVQHIRSYQLPPSGLKNSSISNLSAMDFYLDPNSFFPLAIGFNLHADNNMSVNVPVEIRFANYEKVNGVQVPFHFQQLMNGTLSLDVTITNATFNTGLQDAQFTLQ